MLSLLYVTSRAVQAFIKHIVGHLKYTTESRFGLLKPIKTLHKYLQESILGIPVGHC